LAPNKNPHLLPPFQYVILLEKKGKIFTREETRPESSKNKKGKQQKQKHK